MLDIFLHHIVAADGQGAGRGCLIGFCGRIRFVFEFEGIDKKLEPAEYETVLEHLEKLGFENGFVQGLDSATPDYTPNF